MAAAVILNEALEKKRLCFCVWLQNIYLDRGKKLKKGGEGAGLLVFSKKKESR